MYYTTEQESKFRSGSPPSQPSLKRDDISFREHPIWNSKNTTDWLVDQFGNSRNRFLVERSLELVRPVLSGRFQLGYMPVFNQLPDGDQEVRFRSLSDQALNNRFNHVTQVSATLAMWANKLELDEEIKTALVLSGIIHDSDHPSLSHVGDAFLRGTVAFADQKDRGLHQLMVMNNLDMDHEDRLITGLQDGPLLDMETEHPELVIQRPVVKFLKDELRGEVVGLRAIIREEGFLGSLLKFADTVAYLNHDSIYCDYQPPEFDRYLLPVMRRGREGLVFKDFARGYQVTAAMLNYRRYMYATQYRHPFNDLLEQMQLKTLVTYLHDTEPGVLRFHVLKDMLVNRVDQDIVGMLRRRTLIKGVPYAAGLALFGLPFTDIKMGQKAVGTRVGEIKLSSVDKIVGNKSVGIYDVSGKRYEVAGAAGDWWNDGGPVECLYDGRSVVAGAPIEYQGVVAPVVNVLLATAPSPEVVEYARDLLNPAVDKKLASQAAFGISKLYEGIEVKYRLSEVFRAQK